MPRIFSFILLLINLTSALSFAPTSAIFTQKTTSRMMMTADIDPLLSSSNTIAAATVDPATALGTVLGGLLGSPAILAVPIVAAVSVASLIAFFIVSYANPADPDE
jgi:hypothetical protein